MDVARLLAGLGYVALIAATGVAVAVNVGAVTPPDAGALASAVAVVRSLPLAGLGATAVLGVWGLWRLVV